MNLVGLKHMTQRIMGVALLLLAVSAMARSAKGSAPQVPYLSEDAYRQHVIQQIGEVHLINRFTGEQAQKFLATFNALPPPSDLMGTSVVVFGQTGQHAVLIAFFNNSCMVGESILQDSLYQALLHIIGAKRAQLI